MKEARARRSGHHQTRHQSKRTRTPAVQDQPAVPHHQTMPPAPAYQPLNDPVTKEKRGVWKNFVGFITCSTGQQHD